MKRTGNSVSLFFSAIVALMAILAPAVLADSKHVTFVDPVTVGGTVLKPATYTVVWSGSGPQVDVSFMRGNKVVATASAILIIEESPSRAVHTRTLPDNSKVITRISFRSKSLVFDPLSIDSLSFKPVSLAG
jgi:hypothetical protein